MWTTMDTSGNFGSETFSLRLHPLQDQVPPLQLLKVWTHRLMDAVSDVGKPLACFSGVGAMRRYS